MKKKLIKKLKFTEKQKSEYKKLKVIVGLVGIIGLVLTAILYFLGYRDDSQLTISVTLAFLIIYVYYKYRRILSKSKTTVKYSNFQKEIYSKAFAIFLIPMIIGALIIVFLSFEYGANPWWLLVYFAIIFAIVVIWAFIYEKKKFGTIMKAP